MSSGADFRWSHAIPTASQLPAYLTGAVCVCYVGVELGAPLMERVQGSSFDSSFKGEQLRASEIDEGPAPAAPPGGVWKGTTEESDGAAQAVRTVFDFNQDGTVTGYGEDADDGPYKIKKGRWTWDVGGQPSRAKWTEVRECL